MRLIPNRSILSRRNGQLASCGGTILIYGQLVASRPLSAATRALPIPIPFAHFPAAPQAFSNRTKFSWLWTMAVWLYLCQLARFPLSNQWTKKYLPRGLQNILNYAYGVFPLRRGLRHYTTRDIRD